MDRADDARQKEVGIRQILLAIIVEKKTKTVNMKKLVREAFVGLRVHVICRKQQKKFIAKVAFALFWAE